MSIHYTRQLCNSKLFEGEKIMKKFLAIVCVLAMALSCLFVLASCGGATPNSDPEAAKAALEEAGYQVQMSGSTLIAMLDEEMVMISYCETEEQAKEIYDGYVAAEEAAKQAAEALGESYEDEGEYGYSGKIAWVGTSAAIKAAQ